MTESMVQFFKCRAISLAITASTPMLLSEPDSEDGFDGFDYIAGLLGMAESHLGWDVRQERVGDRDVVWKQLLGSGGFADVHVGHLLGDETSEGVVLKEFKDTESVLNYSFLREKSFLLDFRDDEELKGKIPHLISAGFDEEERPSVGG